MRARMVAEAHRLRQKKKRERDETQPSARPELWAGRIAPFLARHGLAIAACTVALAALRIVTTYTELSITFDEPAHLACGLQYVTNHVYRYEPLHPPLARAMCALGPYFSGIRCSGLRSMWLEGVADFYSGGHTGRTLSLARLGILPFFLLACVILYRWGRRHFDVPTAAIAVVLFTLTPPVLAHAGLATTDMALAACLAAAFFSMLVWAEQPTIRNSLWFGGASALAVLSKFTAFGFLPAGTLFAAVAYLAIERPAPARLMKLLKARIIPLLIALAAGALAVWAVYLFSFGKVQAWGVNLPAPALFDGIARAMQHNRAEGGGYLFGRISPTGWWYFFPVILASKTPIGFLILLASGVYWIFRNRNDVHVCLPLAFSLGVLAPAMTSPVNYGVRHVLPIYLGFSIIAARGVVLMMEWARNRKLWGLGAFALGGWIVISGAIHHPDYLAYTNEFVGSHPENVMVDSDLDWGQQAVQLARRLRELGATSVSFFTMNLDSEHLQAWPGLPPVKPIHPLIPSEGWTAVSPTFWKVGEYGLDHKYSVGPWFTKIQPTERVGSLLLYYVPPGALRQTR